MASGMVGPRFKLAGLERTARLAGEAFGHEEAASADFGGMAALYRRRWFAAMAGWLIPAAR